MRKTRSQTQAENAARSSNSRTVSTNQQQPPPRSTMQQVSQRELDEIKNVMTYFRVHELQALLAAFNVHHAGRKSELQKRALDLLQVNFAEVAKKIREIDRNSNYGREDRASPLEHSAQITSDSNRVMYQPQIQLPVTADVRTTLVSNNLIGNNLNLGATTTTTGVPQFSNNLTSGYPIHPDVRLKKLAFYDVLATILRPSSLVPTSNARVQEAPFYFTLTPQQATEIATNRDIRNGSKVEHAIQVQLRFCLLETSCEQDDCFPPNVIVKVNNKVCPLPNPIPTNRPNVEPKRPPRPVNVTTHVKLSPTVTNTISVTWCPDFTRGYVISAYLVRKLTSQQLLTRMKTKGIKPADYTRALIKEKLTEDADCEIATTMLKVSLICPLGKMRMSIPCRPSTCSHLQCFDASLFLQMNERKATWNCPVCDKPALYDTLVIDGYFQEVLASPLLSPSDNEIQLHKDGSWSTHVMGTETQVKSVKTQKVEVISDDLEVITTEVEHKTLKINTVGCSMSSVSSATSNNLATSNNEPSSTTNNETVDLTLSDSDDDMPLRRKTNNSNKNITSTTIASVSSGGGGEVGQSSVCTITSNIQKSPVVSMSTKTAPQLSSSIISLDSPSPPSSPNNMIENGSVTSSSTTSSMVVCPLPPDPLYFYNHLSTYPINHLGRIDSQTLNAAIEFQKLIARQTSLNNSHSTNAITTEPYINFHQKTSDSNLNENDDQINK